MRRLILSIFISVLLINCCLAAETLALKPSAPKTYKIKEADTLWGIASMFLEKPWQWQQLWEKNGKIKVPERLYPGDILSLYLHNGQPRLRVSYNGVVKLSPKVRILKLERAVPTIPLSEIQPFLVGPSVVNRDELNQYPYVVAFNDTRLTSSMGQQLYARGICTSPDRGFAIFRRGKEYIDPETRKSLGYEAIEIGHAKVEKIGDPSTLQVTNSVRAIRIGDRLIKAVKDRFDPYFIPREPSEDITGSVVTVYGGLSQIGQHQVIIINRGRKDGLKSGYVLTIFRGGKEQRDPVVIRNGPFTLPKLEIARFMIFKTYRHISYALVMTATGTAHTGDKFGKS